MKRNIEDEIYRLETLFDNVLTDETLSDTEKILVRKEIHEKIKKLKEGE